MNFPIYGTKLTLALVDSKLREHGLSGKVRLNVVEPGGVIQFGAVSVEFIHVNHSIPDAVALGIKTPLGYVVHTGDFKIDCTPIMGKMMDLARLGRARQRGRARPSGRLHQRRAPRLYAERAGGGGQFRQPVQKAENKRIIIATFSSNLHRIQQIIDAATKDGRKVAVSGRSMLNFVSIATELGYLTVPEGS